MQTKLRHRLVTAAAAFAFVLAAEPLFANEQGDFEAGTYTAPGQLFTVKSPLGPSPIVIDGFDRSAGAVTFLDESGALYGVICTPNFDVLAGANNDYETDVAILRNWLHDATFPYFFERQLPGAAILREEPAKFEGSPAWIGVMRLPHGSSMIRNDPVTGYPTRQDSVRGLVVFSRDEHTYLIMTETPPEEESKAFLARLAEFYRGISFRSPEEPIVIETFADLKDAGN